jgi:hypothetical protein
MRRILPLLLVLGAACSGGGKHPSTSPLTAPKGPTTTGKGSCTPVPPATAAVKWLPADLPMPPGTQVDHEVPFPDKKGAVFAVHLALADFRTFAQTNWGGKGWTVSDTDFSRADAHGTLLARDVYCDPTWSQVFMTYVDNQILSTTTTFS